MVRRAMRMALALALLVLLGWMFRDLPVVRELTRPVMSSGPARWLGEQASTVADRVNPAGGPQAASGAHPVGRLRKCVGNAEITYTDGECPAGTQRHEVGGALTVLPAQRAEPSAAAASAAPRSPLAELAGPPDQGTLKEKYLESIR